MIINHKQKLHAIEAKFYNGGIPWEPKLLDHYTLTRQQLGLEVFKIVAESNSQWGIIKVWDEVGSGELEQPISWFDKETFLKGFGENRVHLGDWLNNIK